MCPPGIPPVIFRAGEIYTKRTNWKRGEGEKVRGGSEDKGLQTMNR